MFIIKLLSQHVSGIIIPIIRRTRCALPLMVFCTVSDGCGCVELGRKLCAQCTQLTSQLHTICGSAHSCSPDDGHNDARNML